MDAHLVLATDALLHADSILQLPQMWLSLLFGYGTSTEPTMDDSDPSPADLCYFVNVMLLLSLWVFPNSRRLFIAAYCLSYGNNAWAIAMWRNSMVFHSLDKVTSLFIHLMPPVVLHCMVHLCDPEFQAARFPAVARIKTTELYGLRDMIIWATFPYFIWQISYHFGISVSHLTSAFKRARRSEPS